MCTLQKNPRLVNGDGSFDLRTRAAFKKGTARPGRPAQRRGQGEERARNAELTNANPNFHRKQRLGIPVMFHENACTAMRIGTPAFPADGLGRRLIPTVESLTP